MPDEGSEHERARTVTPAGPWTLLQVLQWSTQYFATKGVPSPRLDAELLLSDVLSLPRIQLYAQFERPLSEDERARYRAYVKRRGRREPLQYILGRQAFWTFEVEVARGTLIPRPETEVLLDDARRSTFLAPLCCY